MREEEKEMKDKIEYIEKSWGNEIIFYFNDKTCKWEAYTGGSHILAEPANRTQKITGYSFEEMLDNVISQIDINKPKGAT